MPSDTKPSASRPLDIDALKRLVDAIEAGDHALVEALARGFDFSSLGEAARSNPEINWRLISPLGRAAGLGDERSARILASFCEIDHRGSFGFTPLMEAARSANPRVLRALLELGADPAALDDDGCAALALLLDDSLSHLRGRRSEAQAHADAADCLRALLPRSPVEARDPDGLTVLMLAARSPNPVFFGEIAPLCGPTLASVALDDGTTAMSSCFLVAAFRGNESLALERLEALKDIVPAPAWLGGFEANGARHASLFDAAIAAPLPGIAEWLFDNRLGCPADFGPSLLLIANSWSPGSFLGVAERMIATGVDLASSHLGKGGPQTPLGSLLGSLRHQGDPSMATAPKEALWALSDLIAAACPSLPETQSLWALGGPRKMPRLAARAEADILRQTVRRAAAASSPENASRAIFGSESACAENPGAAGPALPTHASSAPRPESANGRAANRL